MHTEALSQVAASKLPRPIKHHPQQNRPKLRASELRAYVEAPRRDEVQFLYTFSGKKFEIICL